jgi:hypothetical protein
MAYIFDLTLVLEQAFGLVHLKPAPVALDRDMLDVAVQGCRNSFMGEVHHEIRCYASEVGILTKIGYRRWGSLFGDFAPATRLKGRKRGT